MAYTTRGVPWVYKGVTDVTHCKTSMECMEAAHLNFNVKK